MNVKKRRNFSRFFCLNAKYLKTHSKILKDIQNLNEKFFHKYQWYKFQRWSSEIFQKFYENVWRKVNSFRWKIIWFLNKKFIFYCFSSFWNVELLPHPAGRGGAAAAFWHSARPSASCVLPWKLQPRRLKYNLFTEISIPRKLIFWP